MTLPQMIWGNPHIKVEFITPSSKKSPEKYLECRLTNRPIKNRLLRILGVYRRTADDVSARFHILDAMTHKRIATNVAAEIGAEWNIKLMPSISLPASKASAIFRIVKVRADGVATVVDSYDGQNFPLPAGEYYVTSRIYVSGKEINCLGRFSVGTKPEDLRLESINGKETKTTKTTNQEGISSYS
ncbi:hypothetical protein ES703_106736 [subsurface metagenome]